MGNSSAERASDYDSRSSGDADLGGFAEHEGGDKLGKQVARLCESLPPDVREKVIRLEAIRNRGNSSGTFQALQAQRMMGGVEKNPLSVCERQLESNLVWQEYPTELRAALRRQMLDDMTSSDLMSDEELSYLLEQQPIVQCWRERGEIDIDNLDPKAVYEAEEARKKIDTDIASLRVSAREEKAWADKINVEKMNQLMVSMLEENRTYKKLPPELQRLVDDDIRQYFLIRIEPTQEELSMFIEDSEKVRDYYKNKLNEALMLHDAYQSLPEGVQRKIYAEMFSYFYIYIPISLAAIDDFIERHPVVLGFYSKLLNGDDGFGEDEIPTKDDVYDPLMEDTKPDGIKALKSNDFEDEKGMAELVLDDDGNYRIVNKD